MIASVELGGKGETSQPSVPLSAILPYPGESGQFAVVVAGQQSGRWKAHVRKVTVGATHGSAVSVTGPRRRKSRRDWGAAFAGRRFSFSDSVGGPRDHGT
jgi:hypothetical protein